MQTLNSVLNIDLVLCPFENNLEHDGASIDHTFVVLCVQRLVTFSVK